MGQYAQFKKCILLISAHGGIINMAKLGRKEARETALGLLFEREFRTEEDANAIYALALESREIPDNDYVKRVYFGVLDNLEKIDALIGAHSNGWKPERIAKLSRSILRLCVYEMLFEKDIPYSVSINEAVELCKKLDDAKMRPFVNGILNSVKNALEADGNTK